MRTTTYNLKNNLPMPIFPYIGGKRRLAKHILPLFPKHKTYVEPFCGGAAIFFMKEPSQYEVINDINGDIVNLYRVVQHHMEEFIKQFDLLFCSRESFDDFRATSNAGLTDIQRAVKFYFCQKNSFGGFGKTFGVDKLGKPGLDFTKFQEELKLARKRLINAYVEHLSFEKVIEKYDSPDALFYLDPPYWNLTGYGVEFGWEKYELIKHFMKTKQGKFILSINKHPDIVKLFKDFKMIDIDIRYTCNRGEHKESKEVVILG